MPSKRRNVSDLATASRLEKSTSGKRTTQNAFPRVLGGLPLQQLELPKQFISTTKSRPAATTTLKPSNLAVVREKLKSRKPTLG